MRIQFEHFTLDSDRRQLARAGEPIHLPPKAFDALALLASRCPAVVSKAELYEHVWPGTFVVDANLAVLIADIRRVLDDDPKQPRFIRTVHRFGYAFCSDVIDLTAVPAAPVAAPAAAVPAGPRVWLVWDERVILLAQGDSLIGRDPACQVWLDAPGVSRRHARIVVDGTAATIEDVGSKNGTFVNGAAVATPRVLHDGDAVVIGPIDLRFRAWSDGTSSDTVRITRE